MTSASDARFGPTTTPDPRRSGAWTRRLAGALLAAGCCAGSLAVLPAAAHARQGATLRPAVASAPSMSVAAFCAHFPATKISSIIGAKVALFEAVIEKGSWECILEGTREVVISRDPDIPPSELSTLKKAEARFKAESPKGVDISFTALPSLGPTAFSWSYTDNGGLLVGVGNNKGSTAWGAVLGANVKIMGAAAPHVPVVEHLVELDMAVPL
ncbi:MAG: hypothetical protein ABSD97_13810 [Acidimicrobiales bacterium]|jgi:hypothetical protein